MLLHPHNLPSICSLRREHPASLTVKKPPSQPGLHAVPQGQPVSGHQPLSHPVRTRPTVIETQRRRKQRDKYNSCASRPVGVSFTLHQLARAGLVENMRLAQDIAISSSVHRGAKRGDDMSLQTCLFSIHRPLLVSAEASLISFLTTAFEQGKEHPSHGCLRSHVPLALAYLLSSVPNPSPFIPSFC